MKKKLNVLVLSHDSSPYGAQRSLLSLIERLDVDRFSVVVCSSNRGMFLDELKKRGVVHQIVPIVHWVRSQFTRKTSKVKYLLRFVRTLRTRVSTLTKIIRDNEIDVVYTNTVTVIEGAIAALVCRKPHVWHLREQINGNSQLRPIFPEGLIYWIVSRLSVHCIYNSGYLMRSIGRVARIPRSYSVIYNGVELGPHPGHSVNGDRKSLREELGIPGGRRIVATLGSIIPSKNQMLLAEAAAYVGHDAAFLLVGDGDESYAASLRQRIERLGLTERVLFLGLRTDISRILSECDALVICSEEESFGRTAIEAMAASVPVVATRCGGPEEILEDGITGLLVPRNDPRELGKAISRLLEDAVLASNLSAAGRLRAEEKFSASAYAEAVSHILLAAGRPGKAIGSTAPGI